MADSKSPLFPFLAGAAVVGVGFKVLQELFDVEFPGTDYPEAFRRQKIDNHWSWNGGKCPDCDRTVQKNELTVDHIVPIRKGGKNSSNNARVICGPCNSAKGAKVSVADKFFGRGGSRPRRRG